MSLVGTVSDTAICNMALNSIGTGTINFLTENSKQARKCRQFYPFARDAVLRDHPWGFATWWKQLNLISYTIVDPNFSVAYGKPNDCLAVRIVGSKETPFIIEGQYILTNYVDASAKCTFRVTDAAKFDASFVMAFVNKLASVLAIPIRGSKKLSENFMVAYAESLAAAEFNDSLESLENIDDDDRYEKSRY